MNLDSSQGSAGTKRHSRPLMLSLALLVLTVAAGLAIRFVHMGRPFFVVKYGGSALWVVMLYWIVSALLPSHRVSFAAVVTALLATAVELLKLYHSPPLDAFRLTLPGILLLGRIFSVWDLTAYCLAIGAAAVADRCIRRRLAKRRALT